MLSPKSTVLLVDDEVFLRELLVRTLKGADFAVVEAENGVLALETAVKLDGSLVLLVTDITMPVLDGLECARQFRAMNPGVPILFITGKYPQSFFTEPWPNADLLMKPFRSYEFLAAVRRLVTNNERLC